MHSSTVRFGGTQTTLAVMIGAHGRVFRRAAYERDFARVVALGQDPQELVAVEDEDGADVVLGHDAERGEHRVVGADGVNGLAFEPQNVVSRSHRSPPYEVDNPEA